MKWTIEYNNNAGPHGEDFYEWWDVSNGITSFRADSEQDAEFLCEILNKVAP